MMVLLAAIACGLAFSMSTASLLWQMIRPKLFHPEGGDPRRIADLSVLKMETGGFGLVMLASVVLVQFFLPWLAAFAVIRLRRPRPALREVVRQPGTAAVLILGGWYLLDLALAPILTPRNMALVRLYMLLFVASVPAAWIALWWTGHWRSEPGWIDRLGRGLGLLFCLAMAGYFVVTMSLP